MVIKPSNIPPRRPNASRLATAVMLACWSFCVFPLARDKKVPAVKEGFKAATQDPDQLESWFASPCDLNIGIATGVKSAVWVLDVDVKDGALGLESLASLESEHGPLPPTLTVTTASGGKHFYFRCPTTPEIRNRAAILPGIDVRGEGGYVVAPPSSVGGVPYVWDDEASEIAEPPAWLVAVVIKRAKKVPSANTDSNVIAAGSRNSTIMSRAAEQMRKGHSQEVVLDFMVSLNDVACTPPLEAEEVKQIVENVFRLYSDEVQSHCTELGNAQRLAAMYRDEIRYVVESDRWLEWNGNLWEPVDRTRIYALAKEVCKRLHLEAESLTEGPWKSQLKKHALRSEGRREIENMIKLAESEAGITVSVNQLDQHGFILPVGNGIVDLRTGVFRPADKSLLLTHGTSIIFDASAKCPLWMRFLAEVMCGDNEMVTYLHRGIGYNLTSSIQEQCLFFAFGNGANGKSTFLNVLRALMGELGTQAAGETILESRRNSSGPSGDLARLRGKRLVAISETDDGKHLAEAMVKSLSGGDAITARHLYGRDFTFTPVAKFWIASNHKPTIKGSDRGIWRRMRLIPFAATFTKNQQDKHLEQKLMDELPGILNWAIAGCLDWQKNGLPVPLAIANATDEYREDMDILSLWLAECCVVGDGFEIPFAEAYASFNPWGVTNYRCDFSGIKFGKMLKERGFIATTRPQRGYRGLTLRNALPAKTVKRYDSHKSFVRLTALICSMQWDLKERPTDEEWVESVVEAHKKWVIANPDGEPKVQKTYYSRLK